MEMFPKMTMTVAGLDRLTGITDPGRVAGDDERHPDPEVPARARRRTFTAQYKQEILAAHEAAPDGQKGAILRREGLYSSLITEWRRARDAEALAGLKQPRGRQAADPRDARIARLEQEKAKLEQELATSRFVVEVQAKLQALLEKLPGGAGNGNEPTP
jgi:transposase-like protein